ncbi:MAG: hypothetical protein HYS13_25110 [Planctomycetia bacterium]|nr:hypothetical protein [Planctomycetia bacterium]
MRVFLAIAFIAASFLPPFLRGGTGGSAAGQDTAPEQKKPADAEQKTDKASLDDKLQDDLTKDLFDGLEPPKKPDKAKGALDQELEKQLGEGEDLGQPSNPIIDLSRRMREVESLIAEQQIGEPTQEKQRKIVEDLKKLIEEIKKQPPQSSSSSPGRKPRNNQARSQVNQPGKQPGQSPAQQANRNPQQSTERLGQTDVARREGENISELMKRVWGTLPPQEREFINNVMSTQVLPKYEGMIREYFDRLMEMDQEK